jgi:hypothetical protein
VLAGCDTVVEKVMERVIADAEGRVKLNGMNVQLEIADPNGKTVGFFVPPDEFHALMLARLSTEPSPDELEAARNEYRQRGGKPTADVMAHLTDVKRQWEERRK